MHDNAHIGRLVGDALKLVRSCWQRGHGSIHVATHATAESRVVFATCSFAWELYIYIYIFSINISYIYIYFFLNVNVCLYILFNLHISTRI